MAGHRIFEIQTDEKNSKTGEYILTEDKIVDVLHRYRGIKLWAYVMHDKDKYTAADKKKYPDCKIGSLKNRHWHILITIPNQAPVERVAEWFGVPVNAIDIPSGRNAFFDKLKYLTHEEEKEQKKGQYRYPDEEIHANFDWRKKLDEQKTDFMKYGGNLTPKDKLRYDVMYFGKTLRECRDKNKLLYMDDTDRLKKCRLEYICNQEPPAVRYNIYVSGRGGIGKGLLCRALARNLCPQYSNDEDIYFVLGAKGVAFDGYDGQPIIIWDDRRALELLVEMNGRGNVFNIFDTFPTKKRQNIKYGNVNLCNKINIVNGIDPYIDFLDGLADEYIDKSGNRRKGEDGEKGQSYRRFPMIITIEEEYITVLLNRGYMEKTKNYLEYRKVAQIRGNMQRIAEACAGNTKLRYELEAQVVRQIAEICNKTMAQFTKTDVNEEEVRKKLADYGKLIKEEDNIPDGFVPIVGRTPFD